MSRTRRVRIERRRIQARGDRSRPVLVGFAAETHNVLDQARSKLRAKGADLIVANDVSRSDAGFESDDNEVLLVTASGDELLTLSITS